MAAGHKGVKEARFDLLPMDALWMVARVFGKGAEKYAERNWERGLKWGSSKGALDRHLALFWAGQDEDEESGLPHLAHVAWHSLVLLAMYLRGDGEDDRSEDEAYPTMVAEVTNPEDIEAARAEVGALLMAPVGSLKQPGHERTFLDLGGEVIEFTPNKAGTCPDIGCIVPGDHEGAHTNGTMWW